jgi:hypothetical protein
MLLLRLLERQLRLMVKVQGRLLHVLLEVECRYIHRGCQHL